MLTESSTYLSTDESGDYTAQLTRLLRDEETDNCPLLLELVRGGGTNRRVLGYLFGIAVFHPVREIAAMAMTMLQRNAKPDTLRQAQKLKESAGYYYNESEYLSKFGNPEFDLFDFLLAYKMCNWYRLGGTRTNYSLISHQTLNLAQYPENSLSPAIATLDFVRYLALPAHKGFDLVAAMEHLVQLPLESIFIENTRLDEFPVALLQLPRLRTLSIKRGTYRPRQPMSLPEGGPFNSPTLEKFIVDGYPMAGEARLGDFPSLREAILVRCSLGSFDFLQNSKKLESINLKGNNLETLPPFLSDCPELKTLDLSGNPLRVIALNLERLDKLETLDLTIQRKAIV